MKRKSDKRVGSGNSDDVEETSGGIELTANHTQTRPTNISTPDTLDLTDMS